MYSIQIMTYFMSLLMKIKLKNEIQVTASLANVGRHILGDWEPT
jgi:hypothetical protein